MGILSDAAAEAFSDVQAEIPEVIKTVYLVRRSGQGAYVPEIGRQMSVTEQSWPCRFFEATDKPTRDLLAPYVIGPSERVILIEGLTVKPQEGDLIGGLAVRAVADVYGAGAIYVAAVA